MEYTLFRGDFNQYGAVVQKDAVIFTFAVQTTSPAAILFFDSKTHKLAEKLAIPKEYQRGLVYSVGVHGVDCKNLCYLLEFDGDTHLDPYARVISGREKWNDTERFSNHYQVYAGFSALHDEWVEEKQFLPGEEMVMYKLHMRGYTMNAGLSEANAGNVKGFLKKIPELKKFGITTVEFQPIYEFEELRFQIENYIDDKGKLQSKYTESFGVNYWGYGEGNYFAPKASFFGENPEENMRKMVQALHKADMELVMEMSFTEKASEDLIIDALKYWVKEYHVDGFHLVGMGLPIERIVSEPFLADCKIFYDQFPYDLLEQQKNAPFKHLFCYDDGFLYPIRKLQNHMNGSIIEFANLMKRQNEAYSFVNYSAYNTNGFTLMDAYTYSEKHNEANGEENQDGNNFNFSHNYGVEGDSNSRLVQTIRFQHARTALATTILGQAVPLISAGDEIGNTQLGNNNAYGQDNEVGWVSYSKKAQNKKLKEFVRSMIQFRKEHPILAYPEPFQMTDYKHTGVPDLSYHGKEPWIMWLNDSMRSLGVYYNGSYGPKGPEDDLMLCFNFFFEEEPFTLPKLAEGKQWHLVASTVSDSFEKQVLPLEHQNLLMVAGGSVTILLAKEVQE